MPETSASLIEQVTEIRSYGRCNAGTSRIYSPTTLDEARAVFDIARSEGNRVVVRGAGHSFDGQAVHDGDTGQHIVLCTAGLPKAPIQIDTANKKVTLSAGWSWGEYFNYALAQPGPLLIPGSLQTGRSTTVGGSLAGDCLSRFSGVGGKESQWIESFRLLTTQGVLMDVSRQNNPPLFQAVVGGHGYLGLVIDATYRLIEAPNPGFARTDVKLFYNFNDLIDYQNQRVAANQMQNRAISSAWFRPDFSGPGVITAAVFESFFNAQNEGLPPFPLYNKIDDWFRKIVEYAIRLSPLDQAVHEVLWGDVLITGGHFQNDYEDFLFFMDGNTQAKLSWEKHHHKCYQIVQQTFVVPSGNAPAFAKLLDAKIRAARLEPTEFDMLPVAADDCLMSANYKLPGFAISVAFEPIPGCCPPQQICDFLEELSDDCLAANGRLHWVKNVHVSPATFSRMFDDQGQKTGFEKLKKQYDPDGLLKNAFSDKFFRF